MGSACSASPVMVQQATEPTARQPAPQSTGIGTDVTVGAAVGSAQDKAAAVSPSSVLTHAADSSAASVPPQSGLDAATGAVSDDAVAAPHTKLSQSATSMRSPVKPTSLSSPQPTKRSSFRGKVSAASSPDRVKLLARRQVRLRFQRATRRWILARRVLRTGLEFQGPCLDLPSDDEVWRGLQDEFVCV